MTNLFTSLLQLFVILLGRNVAAQMIASARMAWHSFKDQKFVEQCDSEYNILLASWENYKNDREP